MAVWLAGGVVVHDFLLAPLVVALAVGLLAVLPRGVRPVVAGALVVLGTVTVTALPQLTRNGERADNPTLLDRDYTVGWLVFAAVVVAVAVAIELTRRARRRTKEER